MRGQPDQRAGTEYRPGDPDGQVILAQVQHVGTARVSDIGPVVDRQQRAVRSARLPEHLEIAQLLASFQALLPELDDVHAGTQHVV
jgi:hypothetical protein